MTALDAGWSAAALEAIVEWQKHVPPESDDDRPLREGKDRRSRFLGAGQTIGSHLALLPLRYSLRVNPVTPGERCQLS